jgi:hypothetical protein
MACWEIEKGAANSMTVAGPVVRRETIERLVGSDKAAKVELRLSTTVWLCIGGKWSSGNFWRRWIER